MSCNYFYKPPQIGATTSYILSAFVSSHLATRLVSGSESSDIIVYDELSPYGQFPLYFSFMSVISSSIFVKIMSCVCRNLYVLVKTEIRITFFLVVF